MKATRQPPIIPATQPSPEESAIHCLQEAVASGRHWFPALLEAIGMWTVWEEQVAGTQYRYLLGGEALDWQALTERIFLEVDDSLPRPEVERFICQGHPPIEVPLERMRLLLGPSKYQGYLNYLYGVVIERCLQLATAEEVQKEWHSQCYRGPSLADEVCHRVYGTGYRELVQRFRREADAGGRSLHGAWGRKEFSYWLFKHRVRTADKARLASDTKKGLDFWQRSRPGRR
ncbi:MAG: hypothetical protein HYX99_02980 [Chloroflexi bacterium]|nr:hypothetical protein [Chloroflexota bacterium]